MSSYQQVAPIWVAVKPEHFAILEKVLKARNVAHIRKTIIARSNSRLDKPIALENYIDVYTSTGADGKPFCYIGTLDPSLPKYQFTDKPIVSSGIDDNTLRSAAERAASVISAEFQQISMSSSSAQPQQYQQQQVQYVNNGQTIGFVSSPQTVPSPLAPQQ